LRESVVAASKREQARAAADSEEQAAY